MLFYIFMCTLTVGRCKLLVTAGASELRMRMHTHNFLQTAKNVSNVQWRQWTEIG